MNIYDLSRNFFNFSFENPEKIKPNHIAIYFFAVEHCNRLGWKQKFGFPTSMVLEATGIKSYSVYKKTFDELVKFFKASKSSVSNSLNYLLQTKIIDYKTFTSDRKRYFFITDSFFRVYFGKVLDNVKELKGHAYRTVTMRSPEHPDVSEKILKWIENANVFEDSLEEIISSFHNEI